MIRIRRFLIQKYFCKKKELFGNKVLCLEIIKNIINN